MLIAQIKDCLKIYKPLSLSLSLSLSLYIYIFILNNKSNKRAKGASMCVLGYKLTPTN